MSTNATEKPTRRQTISQKGWPILRGSEKTPPSEKIRFGFAGLTRKRKVRWATQLADRRAAIRRQRIPMGLTCYDVMVPTEVQRTIHPDESIATAFNIIRDSRARFLPVVEDDGTYVGVFTAPTLLKLILPKAATIGLNDDASRVPIESLSFMNLTRDDFDQQLERLKTEKVRDNMSRPTNIPVAAPDTPVMEGIFLIYKFKRHVILVEPETKRFVGTVSANSLLDRALS
ncbi:CBS domain-containing protein [Ruegeria arenilitoris]|uniref:CBS domain-containing protein n=2 Tax=Alphaproteobacteria TaxID=28211 RepID=UPI001C2C2671|nr:CBS domain-containing protein [Ruegeria arenilitoris]